LSKSKTKWRISVKSYYVRQDVPKPARIHDKYLRLIIRLQVRNELVQLNCIPKQPALVLLHN